ncbi:MAG TPA: HEAT repeat domain-containing protein [Planctomycetota bacterium]|nr:HEAT repeat domain-containing protein [Planctomycetota bacterium]
MIEGQRIFGQKIPDRGPDVERGILECLRSEDANLRWMAFFVIAEVAGHGPLSKELCAEIQKGINDPDWGPRSVALSCVKLLPTEQSQPILRGFLVSQDLELRFIAVDGLATRGAFDLTETVLPWLEDRSPQIRCSAVQFLARIQDPLAVPFVRRMMEKESTSVVMMPAADFIRTMDAAPSPH